MEDPRRYARLGLFVVVSLTVLTVAVLVLAGRDWWQPSFTFETYFNNSVAGLDLGAPVRFRGVPLGEVTQILTSSATYEGNVPLDRRREYIVVRVKVTLSVREASQMRRDASALVRRGLRAQTQLAGITGQQYLALDFMDPQKYPPLPFDWTPQYMYVPAAPSSVGEIVAKAQSFLASLNDADIKQLGQSLNRLVNDVDVKLGQLPLEELSSSARNTLANADATLVRIDHILARAPIDDTMDKLDTLVGDPALRQTLQNVAALSAQLRKLSDDGDLDRLVKGLDETTGRLDVLLADNQYDVRKIVQDLQIITQNLRAVSNSARRDPAGLLLGGPPEPVSLPGAAK